MATTKGKPKGYFQYLLALDCETTGLKFNAVDPSEGHQALSWGLIVADSHTLKPIEELYLEIKWNDESLDAREADPAFGREAEGIHGLTLMHLEDHGVYEEEAVRQIGELILKYWGPTGNIRTLGHNVATFDLFFMRKMMSKFGINLRFGSRHIDLSSLGFVNFEVYTSDQLFDACGFEERGTHNALEDARLSLRAARVMRMVFQKALND